jgi:choice-of-anchor C domain-containing protein
MNMKFVSITVMAATLALAGAAQASSNLVTNGSFEAGSPQPGNGGFATLGAGSTAMAGWTVTGDSVDWINGYWQASDGTHSVDLNGLGVGGVSQTITTVAGQTYLLTFDLSGNPDSAIATRTLQVTAGDASDPFAFAMGGNSHGAMGWLGQSLTFKALSNSTTINFASTSGDNCCWGPVLDNVSVSAMGGVPEPATWALMLGGFSLAGVALRRRSLATVADLNFFLGVWGGGGRRRPRPFHVRDPALAPQANWDAIVARLLKHPPQTGPGLFAIGTGRGSSEQGVGYEEDSRCCGCGRCCGHGFGRFGLGGGLPGGHAANQLPVPHGE